MSEPQPLSCYIRTLNEERMIGEVIAAALKVADEVILVDSGSTDRTIEIAEGLGARVIRQAWLGKGAQKRVGEDAATHDWLLDLDADEVVSDRLAQSIRDALAAPQSSVYAAMLSIKPPDQPVWIGFLDAPRAKLYDRRVHRQPDDKLWDQLPDIDRGKIPRLDGPLIHHAYRDIHGLVAKMNQGSTADARAMKPRSRSALKRRIVFGFPTFFLRQYVYKGGWRGGVYGFAYCFILSLTRWLRVVKQYEALIARDAGRAD